MLHASFTYTHMTGRTLNHGQMAFIMRCAIKQIADDVDTLSKPLRMLLDDHEEPSDPSAVGLLKNE